MSAPLRVVLRAMHADDWPAVQRIHAEGIATGNATFATEPSVDWAAFYATKIEGCSVVACAEGDARQMAGWAALSPTSARAVYRGVAEVSVYVTEAAHGQGVGRLLLDALVRRSEAHGLWTLQAGIFPENEPSLRLHHACGFRTVGRRERLGWMEIGPYRGRWRDVLLLERRSRVVGVD